MPTCDVAAELVSARAVATLEPAEVAELERHLSSCASCAETASEGDRIAAALALAAPQQAPPPRLKHRLLTEIGLVAEPTPVLSWWRRLVPSPVPAALGAAAMTTCAFLTSLTWGLSLQNQLSEAAQRPAATVPAAVPASGEYVWTIERADMHRLVGSEVAPEARGWIYVDPGQQEALLVAYKLPQLSPDRAYQLWLFGDGQRVSGGTFLVDAEGYGWLKVKAPRPIGSFQGVGITPEPLAGSGGPTGPRVLGGEL